MKNSVQNQKKELDLIDLLKVLLSKLKLIICIALIAAFVGSALGAVITLIGKRDFGTQVEFYISSGDPDSQILHLLSSERFAEKLLLDENGLPANMTGEDYDAALKAKQEADAAAEVLVEAKKAAKEAPRELAVAQKTYEEKSKAYDDVYNILSVYQSAGDKVVETNPEEHFAKMKRYEALAETAKAEKEAAEKAYYEASQKSLAANHTLEAAKEAVTKTKKISDDLAEKILEVWRDQDGIREKISTINESVEYKYIGVDQSNKNTTEKSANQFLVASIAVPADEELAKMLLDSLCEKLPAYVEESTDSINSDEEPDCILLSTAAKIENLAKNSLVKEIIKYAAISTIAALAVTCIVVLCFGVKESDKEEYIEEYAENGDIDAPLV